VVSDKLTPKQEAFALKYVECGNASEAYRHAYDAAKSQPKVIWNEASKVLSNHGVAMRVMELQAEVAERTKVTVESITRELDEDRELARENDQASAAIQASMSKAKLHGLVVNKTEVTRKRALEDLDDGEIDALIASAEGREDEAGEITPKSSSVH
jgi:phage terminase small subunit